MRTTYLTQADIKPYDERIAFSVFIRNAFRVYGNNSIDAKYGVLRQPNENVISSKRTRILCDAGRSAALIERTEEKRQLIALLTSH